MDLMASWTIGQLDQLDRKSSKAWEPIAAAVEGRGDKDADGKSKEKKKKEKDKGKRNEDKKEKGQNRWKRRRYG